MTRRRPILETKSINSALALLLFGLLPGALVAGGLALAPVVGLVGATAFFARSGHEFKLPLGAKLLFAFAVWAAASAAWSPYNDHSQAPRFAATLLSGVALAFLANSATALWVEAAAVAATIVAATMLSIEAIWGMPFNRAVNPEALEWMLARNPGRGVSVLIILVWGAVAALLARGRPLRGLLALSLLMMTGLLSAQFNMDANLAAFAVGICALALGALFPRVAITLIGAALATWLVVAPWATPLILVYTKGIVDLPHSWAVRSEIWRYAIGRIHEAPLVGHGMDAARSFTDTITVNNESMRALPLHPHSVSLHIWLETGAIGAALLMLALLVGGVALGRGMAGRRVAAGAVCALAASVGVLSNISYGAWQEWWVAAICIGAAAIAAIVKIHRPGAAPDVRNRTRA